MPPDFEEVFHSNHDSVVREVARIVGIDAAKDVTADAFAELHRRWDHVSGFDKPGAWVRRVALRRALRELKSKRRRESFLVDAPAVTPFDTFLADTITLRDAINTLPRKQRDGEIHQSLRGAGHDGRPCTRKQRLVDGRAWQIERGCRVTRAV